MDGKLTLKNYRCFDWEHPIELPFVQGFTALVGSNNSGKSTALRAVYELRPFLKQIGCTLWKVNNFRISASPLGVTDRQEIAHESDPSRLEFTIEIVADLPAEHAPAVATSLVCEYLVHASEVRAKSAQILTHQGLRLPISESQIRSAPDQGQVVNLRMSDGALVGRFQVRSATLDLVE